MGTEPATTVSRVRTMAYFTILKADVSHLPIISRNARRHLFEVTVVRHGGHVRCTRRFPLGTELIIPVRDDGNYQPMHSATVAIHSRRDMNHRQEGGCTCAGWGDTERESSVYGATGGDDTPYVDISVKKVEKRQ